MTEAKTAQLQPDWEQDYSTEEFAIDLGHPCTGGGFYLTASDTMLVVPVDVPSERLWWHRNKLPPETVWRAWVWNVPYRDTIFAAMGLVPTRLDTRHHEQPAMFNTVRRGKVDG